MRSILPKKEPSDALPNLESIPEVPSNKRRCVSSACIPCRRRKSKCDGGTPSCSTCTAVYHTECAYDIDGDHRRKGALRRDIEILKERNVALGVIVTALRTAGELDASGILHQLRADEDLEAIAQSISEHQALVLSSDSSSQHGEPSKVLEKPTSAFATENRQFGVAPLLSFAPDSDDHHPLSQAPTESWTKVTNDAELIGHLMDLYFCWLHPFYTTFSKECFLHDMACGRTKYCSPLLVNSVLALASSYSERPVVRSKRHDSGTAGDYFFTEAIRLLNEDGRSTMTTVQALGIMGLREASCGRHSNVFQYTGRCLRMALELGLHMSNDPRAKHISPTEIEVRKITFWGCFIVDTAWALCLGRIPQIPRTAITVEKPTIVEPLERTLWKPYVERDCVVREDLIQASHQHRILQSLCALSEIINDTTYMFFAPRERFTSKRLLDFHESFKQWRQNLPDYLRLTDKSSAQIVCLHMHYHHAVIHLFRPFLKADPLNFGVRPQEICAQSAEGISTLMGTYRTLYGLRRTFPCMTHFAMTASTIHLLDVPAAVASASLAQGILDLETMTINHPFARRCLQVIKKLGEDWAIELPGHVQKAPSSARNETMPLSPTSSEAFLNRNGMHQSQERTRSVSATHLPFTDLELITPAASSVDWFWPPFPDQLMLMQPPDPSESGDMMSMSNMGSSSTNSYSHGVFEMIQGNDPVLGQQPQNEDPWSTI